jgi:hypothetical protein
MTPEPSPPGSPGPTDVNGRGRGHHPPGPCCRCGHDHHGAGSLPQADRGDRTHRLSQRRISVMPTQHQQVRVRTLIEEDARWPAADQRCPHLDLRAGPNALSIAPARSASARLRSPSCVGRRLTGAYGSRLANALCQARTTTISASRSRARSAAHRSAATDAGEPSTPAAIRPPANSDMTSPHLQNHR